MKKWIGFPVISALLLFLHAMPVHAEQVINDVEVYQNGKVLNIDSDDPQQLYVGDEISLEVLGEGYRPVTNAFAWNWHIGSAYETDNIVSSSNTYTLTEADIGEKHFNIVYTDRSDPEIEYTCIMDAVVSEKEETLEPVINGVNVFRNGSQKIDADAENLVSLNTGDQISVSVLGKDNQIINDQFEWVWHDGSAFDESNIVSMTDTYLLKDTDVGTKRYNIVYTYKNNPAYEYTCMLDAEIIKRRKRAVSIVWKKDPVISEVKKNSTFPWPAGAEAVITYDDHSMERIPVNEETFHLDGYNPVKAGKQTVVFVYRDNENLTLSGNIRVIGNEKSSIKQETDKTGKTSETGFNHGKQKGKEIPDTSDYGIHTNLIVLCVSMIGMAGILMIRIRKM